MSVRAWRVGAVAVAVTVVVSSPGAAAAETDTGASAADGSNRFVIKPGQSLTDIASAVVQSNDRAMRDRMVALLFEANPSAFMGRDPNRLKIGAVIQVPDGAATTVTAAASAMSASGAAGNSLPPAASDGATTPGAHASVAGRAAPGGVASSGASSRVILGVTSGASTASASQAGGMPAHQASTPATVDMAALVPEPGSVASTPPFASRAVSTSAVVASQGMTHAPAHTGAPLRLPPAIAAGAAALAFLLVGGLLAWVRRRRRAAATGDMSDAQGVGPREETRAGAARAPDGGLPHRVCAMRTGSEPSDGTAAHAGDGALQAAVVGAAATGVAATAGAAAPLLSGAVLATPTAESPSVTATHAGERHTPLAPDFPAHAAAALASLELSLPPLPSTTSSGYEAAIASAQIVAVERDAPMALPPSVAPPPRLGAAHFGALNLDFDLDLPPLATQPSVALAPDERAAIARNKLNLAVESMKLGDAAGARALVNEVIASNDPTTLEEAQALHAALAPL